MYWLLNLSSSLPLFTILHFSIYTRIAPKTHRRWQMAAPLFFFYKNSNNFHVYSTRVSIAELIKSWYCELYCIEVDGGLLRVPTIYGNYTVYTDIVFVRFTSDYLAYKFHVDLFPRKIEYKFAFLNIAGTHIRAIYVNIKLRRKKTLAETERFLWRIKYIKITFYRWRQRWRKFA